MIPNRSCKQPLDHLKAAIFKFLFRFRIMLVINHAPVKQVYLAVGVAGITGIVRHHTDSCPGLVEFAQKLHDGLAVCRVEVACRLIG